MTLKDNEALNLLLTGLQDKNEQTRTRILYELSMLDNETVLSATTQLFSTKSEDEYFLLLLTDLLLDKARTDSRFIIPFIEHADLKKIKEAIPTFASFLLSETDINVLQSIIRAIGETGEKSCVNVVGDFIFYDDPILKREAITALGKIGGPNALERLKFASSTNKADDFLISTLEKLENELSDKPAQNEKSEEQFASRQDTGKQLSEDSIHSELMSLLGSSSPLDRFKAMTELVKKGPRVIPAVIESMENNEPRTLINGLSVIGKIGNETALPAVLKILNSHHKDPCVRFAVCETMAKLPSPHSPLALMDCITDPEEHVRIAAAAAMNRNPSDIMISGLKSKIETAGKKSGKTAITSAIIDSHADKLFTSLLNSDAFIFIASELLSNCHENTVKFFTDILLKRGTRALAMSIRENIKNKQKKDPLTIFCVDESPVCLRYQIKQLYNEGHAPHGFGNSSTALAALKKRKPDLLMTIFNTSGEHELHLIENIRNIYGKRELPVVLMANKHDLADMQNPGKRLDEILCLTDLVLQKPLDIKTMRQLLDKIHKTTG